ncbi:MAG: CapA family protein [Clostridia bacterium]|nr:CapA family protein [Clostridia bacterium]
MRPKISVTAAGDFLPQRRIPEAYEGFEEVSEFIKRGDARFFNLETTFPDEHCFGHQFYGGAYLRADTRILDDARRYGFNVLAYANNHTMDYAYRGLELTMQALAKAGFPSAGAGRNLDEAAAPAYLDTPKGSVGVIGVVSTMMNIAAMAGRQSRRIPGRPGVNGLRVDDYVEVTPEQYAAIKEVVELSQMNAQADISRAEGFTPPLPLGVTAFRTTNVRCGEKTRYVTHPNKRDMDRIIASIKTARAQCDYVMVSMHSHEVGGPSKELPGDFYTEFAHACIDAGATAILGHGPHIIRPIEIYKGCPIFYCMGNFIFQEELTEYTAEDQFEKYGLTSDTSMGDMYDIRTEGHTRGLLCDRRVMEAFIPYFEIDNDKVTKIELMPIDMGVNLEYWQMGLPRPGFGMGILERLAEMSRPYGTKISIHEDGIGVIEL